MANLVNIIIIIAVAIAAWWAAERFSPDALLTKIVQLVIFVAVLILLVTKLWPLV